VSWDKGGENVISAGWQATLRDPIWHVSSRKRRGYSCKLLYVTFTLVYICGVCVVSTRWVVGDWQPCSVSCGTGGLARRHLYCVREHVDLSQLHPVPDHLCLKEDRPPSERPCDADLDCPTWVAGQWSHVRVHLLIRLAIWRSSSPTLSPQLQVLEPPLARLSVAFGLIANCYTVCRVVCGRNGRSVRPRV